MITTEEWEIDGEGAHKAYGELGQDGGSGVQWAAYVDEMSGYEKVEAEWKWEAAIYLYENASAMKADNEFDEIVIRLDDLAEAKRHVETVVRVLRERNIVVKEKA